MLARTFSWRFSSIEAIWAVMADSLARARHPSRTNRASSATLRPRLPLLHVGVVGQAQHPLGDDVALHLAGAASHREGRREEEPVVPHRGVLAERAAGAEHAAGTREVLG